MASKGMSLVGFLDAEKALAHLGQQCVPQNPDPAALKAEWLSAKGKLGSPMPNAGRPDIQSLPAAANPYMASFRAAGWVERLATDADLSAPQFAMVEISPLLAFQLTIENGRSEHHCGSSETPPSLNEMLAACLPLSTSPEQMNMQKQDNSLIIKARSLNIRKMDFGVWGNEFFGITVGPSLPMVQVVRYNDLYFLWNGFHRSYGFAKAGATHIPCVLRDAANHQKVAQVISQAFGTEIFKSNDPPTVGHYSQDRAHPVMLKTTSRVIHISWAEWTVAED